MKSNLGAKAETSNGITYGESLRVDKSVTSRNFDLRSSSTTIPAKGVGSSDPKQGATHVVEDMVSSHVKA